MRDDGGPAFPVQDASKWQSHGMTMRQWYAGLAMQGILAGDHPIKHDQDCLQKIAAIAHKQADEMIKESNK